VISQLGLDCFVRKSVDNPGKVRLIWGAKEAAVDALKNRVRKSSDLAPSRPNPVTEPVSGSPVPQDGDLVVARASKSAVRFTVRQVPGDVQFSSPVRDEAVRLAAGFAKKNAVDLWYSDDAGLRLLETHRRQP
jgi:hypothetical protein